MNGNLITGLASTAVQGVAAVASRGLAIAREEGVTQLLRRIEMRCEAFLYHLITKHQKLVVEIGVQDAWPAALPLVSVIIPCYNNGACLESTIQSVLRQSFKRFEIIVIDDGSTDRVTKRLLDGMQVEKTKVVRQFNQGLAQTKNNGAISACGKYLCFLAPEEVVETTYFEKTLYLLECDSLLGSCYSWVQCFGECNSVWVTDNLDPYTLKRRNTAPSHAVIRKQAWEAVREFNGAGFLSKYNGYFEDWAFWIDMLQCGYRGQVIREPLTACRVDTEALVKPRTNGYLKMLKVLHEDRRRFFYDRIYTIRLQTKLCRRAYVANGLVNLLPDATAEL